MRARRVVVVPLVALVVGLVLLAGCTSEKPAPKPAASSPTAPPPSLGASTGAEVAPPTTAMDKLEKPVFDRLAAQVRRQGLSLAHLDCPRWDGTVPERMACRAYVDGLVVKVRVHLKAAVEGKAVSFDADLADGVIATQRLEETLTEQGGTSPDCGSARAYPAKVGLEIVCRVTRDGEPHYVVATVSNRSGRVMIADHEPAS